MHAFDIDVQNRILFLVKAMQRIEPGISRFPDAQLRIWGLVLMHHLGMTEMSRSKSPIKLA